MSFWTFYSFLPFPPHHATPHLPGEGVYMYLYSIRKLPAFISILNSNTFPARFPSPQLHCFAFMLHQCLFFLFCYTFLFFTWWVVFQKLISKIARGIWDATWTATVSMYLPVRVSMKQDAKIWYANSFQYNPAQKNIYLCVKRCFLCMK